MIGKLRGLLLFTKMALLMMHSNYRPISVLLVIARLFEKLAFDQMYSYLNDNKLLYSKLSGFRSMHSVLSCLLKCTNDSYLNLDKGNVTSLHL